jgi:hypothetical protein
MSYRDKVQYPKKHPLSVEGLVKVTPTDICKWVAFKAYRKEDPGPSDNPTFGRSSSLSYYKKRFRTRTYMPHRLMHWNLELGIGNPTKSADVNDLIKAVIKKETRQEGRKSQARRPFEKDEFVQVIRLCNEVRREVSGASAK